MKRIKLLLPAVLVFCLAGCFQIDEQIDVKADGSGQLNVNTDMSQLLDIMQNYMGKEEMDKQLPQKVMDTTVMMKDMVDTMKNISAEKKQLLKNARMHMQLNMDEKLFKADMHLPFDNMSDLQKVYNSMNDGSLGAPDLFRELGRPGVNPGNDSSAAPDMSQFNAIYDFQSKDGLLSRKLNDEKWKKLQQSPEFEQMKQATSMGVEIPYSLTINLPRPVKKVDNALATLSPDKKTVTIKYNLIEVLEHPEKFEYTIVY